jgi:hypothetical protein
MSGHAQASPVRAVDERGQLVPPETRVGLERRRAGLLLLVDQLLDAGGVGRSCGAMEVPAREIQLRSGLLTGVDAALDVRVRGEVEGAGRPERRHAGGKVEPRKGPCRRDVLVGPAGRDGVKKVIVHSDQAGDDGMARKV